MRKYWLVEVIENDCIVTQVGVYDEISREPSGNPSGSGDISLYTPRLVTIQLQSMYLGLFRAYIWVEIIRFVNVNSKLEMKKKLCNNLASHISLLM